MIYHITTPSEWQAAQVVGIYKPKSFDQEGFIHCSDAFQIEGTANRYYLDVPELIVLKIDPEKTAAEVIYENPAGRTMRYPHLYGLLEVSAVEGTFWLERNEAGKWALPLELQRPSPALITEIPFDTPGILYRTVTPGSYMFDPDDAVFDLLKARHVDWAVVLNQTEEHEKYTGNSLLGRYALDGIQTLYAGVPDFSAPPSGQWNADIQETIHLLEQGKNVAIHCHAGIGRTGMFLACMAQDYFGMTPDESITWVRQFIPGAVETLYQMQFVRDYPNHK
jgi:uncharacterized protein (DUF952 family)